MAVQALRQRQARKAWIHRLANPPQRPRGEFAWGKGARVLLLVSRDDAQATSATSAFAKTYRAKGFDVSVLGFAAAKTKPEEREPETWGPHALGFAGLPKPEFEDPIRRKEYDLVVHASLTPFAPFDYLTAGLSAHRRVCAHDEVPEAYDLIVAGSAATSVDAFLREAIRLLQLIDSSYA